MLQKGGKMIQTQLSYEEEDYIIESGMEKKKDERGN